MDAFVLLFTLAILLALGMPVAFAVGLSAVAGALWIDLPLEALMIQITSGVNKFTLLAIPFFILAGAIMAEGGIARRLVNFAYVFVGFIRGGLSLVNIVASTFFGAISGSSVADTASIGSVMIPEMEKKGYPREYAAAVTASGSVQAILIPPSHNSVIYSLAAGGTVSIATLFIAGVLPGLLLGVSLMVLCLCFARKRGYPKGDKIPFMQALKIMLDALWGLMTVVIILGGILSGIFTATESAAVACLWAFFVTMFIYRDYKWNELPKLMCRTVKTVTIVMILIGFAAAFGAVMTYMQLPTRITEFFTSLSDNKYVILMYLNVMLLLIGTLMDMAPIILILTPVLLPVTNSLGIDPVHFGMIMMVNLGIGLITPPVGSVLFVASAVSKQRIETVGEGDAAVLRHAAGGAGDGNVHPGNFTVAAGGIRDAVTPLFSLSPWERVGVGHQAAP
ncbi:TRAP dicarboxylate transporter, DctM subunit [Enterobacter cancerogenus]|uniref:TRAP transporter large permease protein n=8 Tax=Gammaproteobacteria TaxID=1236 RepID=A0A484YX90_9ENTR|nr:TRAP dicarboxylate transporter, DctM subunit [Enterobacter cancerogenus]